MSRRLLTPLAAGLAVLSVIGAAGCAAEPAEDVAVATGAMRPVAPATSFELAAACARNLHRHASVRDVDMAEGVVRWGCGDVPGVTDDDLGQEYCEYQAVQGGVIKKQASEIDPDGPPVACVFTSVFTSGDEEPKLAAAMASADNLGAAAITQGITQMRKRFNARGAATKLIADCAHAATSQTALPLRTAACYTAWAKGGPKAGALLEACKGDLAGATAWTKAEALGAKIAGPGDDAFEAQRDIASCMTVRDVKGAAWRNSDPMICSRVARSAGECGCAFDAIPSSVVGLPFTGWVDDQLPPGCRLAQVDGADYPYIAICSVTAREIADLPLDPLYARNVGNFCHDRFAVDLVMKLPLRALEAQGTCKESPGFCDAYTGEEAPPPAPRPGRRPL